MCPKKKKKKRSTGPPGGDPKRKKVPPGPTPPGLFDPPEPGPEALWRWRCHMCGLEFEAHVFFRVLPGVPGRLYLWSYSTGQPPKLYKHIGSSPPCPNCHCESTVDLGPCELPPSLESEYQDLIRRLKEMRE